jgi:hypothetical protein
MTRRTVRGRAGHRGERGCGENEANERDDFDLSDYFQDDDTPDYKLSVKNSGPDEEEREIPLAGGTTFQDNLKAQLSLARHR